MKYTSIYTSVENATKSMLKHCENVLNGANVSYKTATIYRMAYQHAIDDIKTLPAADVVEVIRCKDCVHWNSETNGCKRNPSVQPWYENDFCKYGEKMEATNEQT